MGGGEGLLSCSCRRHAAYVKSAVINKSVHDLANLRHNYPIYFAIFDSAAPSLDFTARAEAAAAASVSEGHKADGENRYPNGHGGRADGKCVTTAVRDLVD